MDELEPVGLLIQGVPPNSPLFNNWKVIAGRKLQPGDTNQVILGKSLAATLNKKPGDKLTVLDDQEFQVVGVFEAGTTYEDGMMIMAARRPAKIHGPQRTCYRILDRFGRPLAGSHRAGGKRIAGLAKNLDVKTTQQLVDSTNEIRFIHAMAWVTSTVALFIGAIGMLNTMIMSVFERTKEIGVLRAIGWGRWRVVKMILMESILLSLLGGAVGTLAAMLLTNVLSRFPSPRALSKVI